MCRGECVCARAHWIYIRSASPMRIRPPPASPPSPVYREQRGTSSMCIRELALTRKTPSDWIQLCKGWREFYASALAAPSGITWSRRGQEMPLRETFPLNKFLTIYQPDVNSPWSPWFEKNLSTCQRYNGVARIKRDKRSPSLFRAKWESVGRLVKRCRE